MTTKLADLLIAVAEDPERLTAFVADPEPEMDDAELTEAEKDAVRNRDAAMIESLTGGASLPNWASACWMVAARSRKLPRPQPSPKRRPGAPPPAKRRTPARGTRRGAARKPKRGHSGGRGR